LALQLFGRFEVAAVLAARPVFRKAARAMGCFDYWFIRHWAYSVQTGSSSLKVALAIFQSTIDRHLVCQILRISALISPNGVFRNGCSAGNFFKSIITSLFTRAFRVPPRSLVCGTKPPRSVVGAPTQQIVGVLDHFAAEPPHESFDLARGRFRRLSKHNGQIEAHLECAQSALLRSNPG
jgi:hypothetical protein